MAADQGGICTWCKLPLPEDLESGDVVTDHIIPRCRGGTDASWNLQVLHAKCNGPGGKGRQLTPEAERLAALHGVKLREPLPTSWPGSNAFGTHGKPNPYRTAAPAPAPLPRLAPGAVQAAEAAAKRAGIEVDRDAIRIILRGAQAATERHVRRQVAQEERRDRLKSTKPAA